MLFNVVDIPLNIIHLLNRTQNRQDYQFSHSSPCERKGDNVNNMVEGCDLLELRPLVSYIDIYYVLESLHIVIFLHRSATTYHALQASPELLAYLQVP